MFAFVTSKRVSMEGFWIGALRYCGSTAVAGLVAYTIYPQILASPYLKNLTHSELLALMALVVVAAFFLCLAIINAGIKRSQGNNTITLKRSTVHGNVQAGNNSTYKNDK